MSKGDAIRDDRLDKSNENGLNASDLWKVEASKTTDKVVKSPEIRSLDDIHASYAQIAQKLKGIPADLVADFLTSQHPGDPVAAYAIHCVRDKMST